MHRIIILAAVAALALTAAAFAASPARALAPEHALLNRFEGSWTELLTFKASPQAEAVLVNETAHNRVILGGHYLECRSRGFSGAACHEARLAMLDVVEGRPGARERVARVRAMLECERKPKSAEWSLAEIYVELGQGNEKQAAAAARRAARDVAGPGLLKLLAGKLRWLAGRPGVGAAVKALSPPRSPRTRA